MWTVGVRHDYASAVKECARRAQMPDMEDLLKVKNILKYMIGTKQANFNLKYQFDPEVIDITSDASCCSGEWSRSTSGAIIKVDGVLIGSITNPSEHSSE